MKVYVIWASNSESYEDNDQDIWAICGSREAAEQCIANVPEQIRRDEERWNELLKITSDNSYLDSSVDKEMSEIDYRRYLIHWLGCNDGLPYFYIREYDMMN